MYYFSKKMLIACSISSMIMVGALGAEVIPSGKKRDDLIINLKNISTEFYTVLNTISYDGPNFFNSPLNAFFIVFDEALEQPSIQTIQKVIQGAYDEHKEQIAHEIMLISTDYKCLIVAAQHNEAMGGEPIVTHVERGFLYDRYTEFNLKHLIASLNALNQLKNAWKQFINKLQVLSVLKQEPDPYIQAEKNILLGMLQLIAKNHKNLPQLVEGTHWLNVRTGYEGRAAAKKAAIQFFSELKKIIEATNLDLTKDQIAHHVTQAYITAVNEGKLPVGFGIFYSPAAINAWVDIASELVAVDALPSSAMKTIEEDLIKAKFKGV